jgi:hypothetical protein
LDDREVRKTSARDLRRDDDAPALVGIEPSHYPGDAVLRRMAFPRHALILSPGPDDRRTTGAALMNKLAKLYRDN